MTPVIGIFNLCRKAGTKELIKNISLTINSGEIFAIIGPSGSGKTTLIRTIDLLDAPSSGTIVFKDEQVTRDKKQLLVLRRKMGMVFQKPVVLSTTVFENVAYGLKYRGVKKEEIHTRVTEAIDLVGLSGYEERYAPTLSGGEMQRVAIARSMVTGPEVLLLDEPTANLDPASGEKIESLIQAINRRFGTTIIMSTHDLGQGRRIAHRIGVVMDGEIAQTGTPEEIFQRPATSRIARFVGIENIIEGKVERRDGDLVTVSTQGTTIEAISPAKTGDIVFVSISPDDITLNIFDSCEAGTSARNSIPGVVSATSLSGPFVVVNLDCGFPLHVLITRRSAEDLGVQPGKNMWACFKATAVHVMNN